MTDDLDRMLSGGAKSAFRRETPIGTTVTGIIKEIEVRQATEYETGKPLTFPSGDPKEQIVVTIQAEGLEPDDPDDDLVRAVYIKGWGQQRRAFQEAAKRDGKPGVGDRFTATFARLGVNQKGGFPPKEFEYRITRLEQAAEQQWQAQPGTFNGPDSVEAKRSQLRALGMTEAQIDAVLVAGDDTPF